MPTSWLPGLALLGIVACTGTEPAEDPPLAGRIVYSSDRTGEDKLYVMDQDGSDFGPLPVSLPGRLVTPDVSPDGERVAFDYYGDIYVARADGSGLLNVTADEEDNSRPSWSPDGLEILFTSGEYDGSGRHLYVIGRDGTGVRQLTGGPTTEEDGDWSPDGSRIVFTSSGEGGGLETINVDGTGRQLLLADSEGGYQPAWSPDGGSIVFVGRDDNDLYLVNSDGSNKRRLGCPEPSCTTPAWSPDGQSIAYVHLGEIILIGADGEGTRTLTNSPNDFDYHPAWGPGRE